MTDKKDAKQDAKQADTKDGLQNSIEFMKALKAFFDANPNIPNRILIQAAMATMGGRMTSIEEAVDDIGNALAFFAHTTEDMFDVNSGEIILDVCVNARLDCLHYDKLAATGNPSGETH